MTANLSIDPTDLHAPSMDNGPERVTGYVMLVGNGAVGKTTVSRVLSLTNRGEKPDKDILNGIRKTKNLEYEFLTTEQKIGDRRIKATLQFLVPPGQKKSAHPCQD